ncbi:MAG: carbohydrate ABC transporter permease [Actinomycetota bacterium]|nr:carbohydrate ABC transporter permease [Actinomycetota bacterium]
MTAAIRVGSRQLLLVVLCVLSLYPLWFMLDTALKSPQQYALNPTGLASHPTFVNFQSVFSQWPFLTWVRNSLVATVVSVGVATVVAMMAAYAIVFSRGRGRELFVRTNIALMAIPPVALLVPMYTLMVQLHLINQLPAVIIFYCGLLVPFSVFFFVNFFREIPFELVEAARMDGASPSRVLVRVILPISGASTFTLVIVNAIFVWNELLIALVFLQANGSRTLMAGLALYQGRYVTNEPLLMAAAFLSVVPLGVLYVFGQRFFVRGLTAGIGK